MTTDIDIYRTAKVLIDEHGVPGALLYAGGRGDALLEEGDVEGSRVWGRICSAIEDISPTRSASDRTH